MHLARVEQPPAGVDLVGFEQRVADVVALRQQEREAHPTANEHPVDPRQQVFDDGELVGDLGAAEDDDVRPLRVMGEPLQHLDLAQHQLAGRMREAERYVVHARVLAVHGTERVADVAVGERSQPLGEGAAFVVVLARLARLEPDVLQHGDVAVGEPVDRLARRLTGDVVAQRNVGAEQLGQPVRDRSQGQVRTVLALGPTQVSADDDTCARVAKIADGRQAGADPAVVGDALVLERDVEIGPDEDAPAAEVAERVDPSHVSREPTSRARSTSRFE